MSRFFEKLKRKAMHLRLSPIRVFCFHHVSDKFEPDTMMECDWTQTEVFKQHILALKEKRFTFIPLSEVTMHLEHDRFRFKKYAALVADDGWASLKNVLPWLDEQNVPVTLFVNPAYLDGNHFRVRETERYLTQKELEQFASSYKGLSVASHGWEHKNVSGFSESSFQEDVDKSRQALCVFPCHIPYYAYPWGRHTSTNDRVLHDNGLIPVLMDGMKNYSDPLFIHRELLMG